MVFVGHETRTVADKGQPTAVMCNMTEISRETHRRPPGSGSRDELRVAGASNREPIGRMIL